MSRKYLRFAVVLALLLGLSLPVAAEAPFYDYTYDEWGDPVGAPRAYDLFQVADAAVIGTALKGPSDLCVSGDEIYIADTGNNRIVVLDSGFRRVREWNGTDSPDGRLDFAAPEGVFVAEDGRVLIADTGNGRLVVTRASTWAFCNSTGRAGLSRPSGRPKSR